MPSKAVAGNFKASGGIRDPLPYGENEENGGSPIAGSSGLVHGVDCWATLVSCIVQTKVRSEGVYLIQQ